LSRRRYLGRLSGPLLDRVDLQVDVLALTRAQMLSEEVPESSADVALRVVQARLAQRARLTGTPWTCNGEVPGSWLRSALKLPGEVTRDLDGALDRGRLSVRGYDRVLRAAWTVSDLGGRDLPSRDDIGRALVLRHRRQVIW